MLVWKDKFVHRSIPYDHVSDPFHVDVSSSSSGFQDYWIDDELLHSIGLRGVEARSLGVLLHLYDSFSLIYGDVANVGVEVKEYLTYFLRQLAHFLESKPQDQNTVRPN